MQGLLLVMAGGAMGAGARYGVGRAVSFTVAPGFPLATLAVNLVGGLLMGLLAGGVVRFGLGDGWLLLLGVGVLGGFTTFSAFSLELFGMIERGALTMAAGYAALSVVGSVLLVGAGLHLSRIAP